MLAVMDRKKTFHTMTFSYEVGAGCSNYVTVIENRTDVNPDSKLQAEFLVEEAKDFLIQSVLKQV